MKMVPDTTRRFAKRPHYETAELDLECNRIVGDFLKKKYGEATFPISTDDLTSLVESEAEDLDLYADLAEFGEGVEGVTIFQPGARPLVKINKDLTENASKQNRLRTTLTHEFGHVHFHNYLFDTALGSLELFAASPVGQQHKSSIQVCKRDTMLNASQYDWMEWQAGHVCGAILMPSKVTRAFVFDSFKDEITNQALGIDSKLETRVIEAVAGKFQVSKDAAKVRLLRLKIISAA